MDETIQDTSKLDGNDSIPIHFPGRRGKIDVANSLQKLSESYYNSTRVISPRYDKSKIDREWLACEVTNITMATILVYVIISLTVYHKKKGLRNFVHRTKSKVRSKRFESALDCLTVAGAVFGFIRIFTDIDGIVGRDSELNCSYLKKPKIFISFVSFGCICINYWLRQRIIHGNKQLSHLSNFPTKVFGVVFLVIMSLTFVANLILFMIKDQSEYHPIPGFGCSDGKGMVEFYILAAASVITQVTLVVLLIFPILKRGDKFSSKIKMKREHRLIKMVFRAFITAVAGVFFTIGGLLFLTFMPVVVDDIGMLAVNINLFVLVFCSIMSFADWRKRLFPLGKISAFDRTTSLSVRSLQMT